MYNSFKLAIGLVCLIVGLSWAVLNVSAQTPTTNVMKSVTCNATGSSNSVFPANGSRTGFVIINDSGLAVRISSLTTGAALTDANSIVLTNSASYSTGQPGQYQGPIFCMSTGIAATIHTTEATFP